MRVRCIGKFSIAVGNGTYRETMKAIKDTFSELNNLGVRCVLYLKRRLIVTDNVIIKFIIRKYYYNYSRNRYGVRCHGCYGFTDEESYSITNGKNKCKGYELLDYILERGNKV
jgi:hypothetical protein